MFKKNPLWNFSIVVIIIIALLAIPLILYFFEPHILIFFIAGIILGIISLAGIVKLAYIIVPESKSARSPESNFYINACGPNSGQNFIQPQIQTSEPGIKTDLKTTGLDFFDKIKLAFLYLTKLILFTFFFWQASKIGIIAVLFFVAGFSTIIPALLLSGLHLKSNNQINL